MPESDPTRIVVTSIVWVLLLVCVGVVHACNYRTFPTAPRVISTSADSARSVYAADVDGDGDLDVLSASSGDDTIAWYENMDGAGTFTPLGASEHVITTTANGAQSVVAADIDGDGDLDVLSAFSSGDKIVWYENMDGSGTFTPLGASEHVISTTAIGSVYAADVDGDGDLDVLSASWNDDTIAWYENMDGAGTFTPLGASEHVITTTAFAFSSVFAADVDGDGDLDVLSASDYDDTILWYENMDGAGTFTPLGASEHVITTTAFGAQSVVAADVDGDGDLDVLSAFYFDDTIVWYENMDGAGTFTPLGASEHVITTTAFGALSVVAADVDGDGDLDVLSASRNDDKIAWYENMDGSGTFTPLGASEHVITTTADGAYSVYAADIDGDGDLDVLSASYNDDTIAWYENTACALYPVILEKECLELSVTHRVDTVQYTPGQSGQVLNYCATLRSEGGRHQTATEVVLSDDLNDFVPGSLSMTSAVCRGSVYQSGVDNVWLDPGACSISVTDPVVDESGMPPSVSLTLDMDRALRGYIAVPDGFDHCFVVADRGRSGNTADLLQKISRGSGRVENIGFISGGGFGGSIEAAEYDPFDDVLYVMDGDVFGTLSTTTGAFTNRGPIGSCRGRINGSTMTQSEPISDVDGLSLNPSTGELWATERRPLTGQNDLLFRINLTGGSAGNWCARNTFGNGVDFVEIRLQDVTSLVAQGIHDVDDIAFDTRATPYARLLAIANSGTIPGGLVELTYFDETTGDVAVQNANNQGGTGQPGTVVYLGDFAIADFEGLSFAPDGRLYATTGGSSEDVPGGRNNAMWQISPSNASVYDLMVSHDDYPLNGEDYEAVACFVESTSFELGPIEYEFCFDVEIATTSTGDIESVADVTWVCPNGATRSYSANAEIVKAVGVCATLGCHSGFGSLNSTKWCSCCANDCGGFRSTCIESDGFCVTRCRYDVVEYGCGTLPTQLPTAQPTSPPRSPTGAPTKQPTDRPTMVPSKQPTDVPTKAPTDAPFAGPTISPTKAPTVAPTDAPTKQPTNEPTRLPTKSPTDAPTDAPTEVPSKLPTKVPTDAPTDAPTKQPPTDVPMHRPTNLPTNAPAQLPTRRPTQAPTRQTTNSPSQMPTRIPTRSPTTMPTVAPVLTSTPTESATNSPTLSPTRVPSRFPTHVPTLTPSSSLGVTTRPPTMPPITAPSIASSATTTTAQTDACLGFNRLRLNIVSLLVTANIALDSSSVRLNVPACGSDESDELSIVVEAGTNGFVAVNASAVGVRSDGESIGSVESYALSSGEFLRIGFDRQVFLDTVTLLGYGDLNEATLSGAGESSFVRFSGTYVWDALSNTKRSLGLTLLDELRIESSNRYFSSFSLLAIEVTHSGGVRSTSSSTAATATDLIVISDRIDVGALVGGGVGALFLILLLVIALCMFKRRRARQHALEIQRIMNMSLVRVEARSAKQPNVRVRVNRDAEDVRRKRGRGGERDGVSEQHVDVDPHYFVDESGYVKMKVIPESSTAPATPNSSKERRHRKRSKVEGDGYIPVPSKGEPGYIPVPSKRPSKPEIQDGYIPVPSKSSHTVPTVDNDEAPYQTLPVRNDEGVGVGHDDHYQELPLRPKRKKAKKKPKKKHSENVTVARVKTVEWLPSDSSES